MSAPTHVIFEVVGPSHASHAFNSAPVNENGSLGPVALPASLHGKRAREIIAEELTAAIPGLNIGWADARVKAGMGINAWATDAAITSDAQAAITSLINRVTAGHSSAKALFVVWCCNQEWQDETISTGSWNLRHRTLIAAVQNQFWTAHPGRDLEIWIVQPGNRGNTVHWSTTWKLHRLNAIAGHVEIADNPPIPGVFVYHARNTQVLSNTNATSDVIHYARGQTQRMGYGFAHALLHAWGVEAHDAPRVVHCWRPEPTVVKVRIRHRPGYYLAGAEGSHGANSPWMIEVAGAHSAPTNVTYDRTLAAQGYTDVSMNVNAAWANPIRAHVCSVQWMAMWAGSGAMVVPHEVETAADALGTGWDDLTASPRKHVRVVQAINMVVSLDPPPAIEQPGQPEPLTLEERVAALEARVDALEAAA